jgi:hypothetical protein
MNTLSLYKLTSMVFAGALALVVASPSGIENADAEAQPHMRAAVNNLRQAESQLEKASHDKGGHRAAALAATRTAIAEAEKAIAFDNKH